MQVPSVSYYIYVYSGKSMTEEIVSLFILINILHQRMVLQAQQ